MPWKDTTVMEQKLEFITEWKSGNFNLSELCREFGISRPTGYKYINRYQEDGIEGLQEIGRRPKSHPRQTLDPIEKAILKHRKAHPRWGAKKIWKLLHREFNQETIPCVTTINRILKRNGLIITRKRRPRVKPVYPIFDPKSCNDVWSADFKGKFRMGNKRYCHPLTIADSFSRFVFAAKGLYGERFLPTQKEFKHVFKEYGLPKQIHTDNGRPFGAVQAIQRLTRLSVWFIEQGIDPVYSDPAHPEQNGRHERMHKDLKGEATKPPGYNLRAQQRKLNRFVEEYNIERPHEALGLETPGSVHVSSLRQYKNRVSKWEYPLHFEVRRVCRNGALRWGTTKWIMISTTLIEKYVGLEEIGQGIWRVLFRQKLLGYFEEKVLRIQDELGRLKRNNL